MKVNVKSYPHPVLGNEDDLGGSCKVEFHYELRKEQIVLNPVFTLKNAAIEDLIKKGKASFVAEIECRSTFFRKSFSTRNPIEQFSIPANRVREYVTVSFYVCADSDINYKPSECHPDYQGTIFDLEMGDVLAVGGSCSFIAEKNFDPLRPPVSSFMSIREGTKHEGPMEIDYEESDKIMVILSKADWKNYIDVRGQKLTEGILHAAIVLPVLVDAIHQISNSDYEFMNWFKRLQAIIDAKGLHDKEPFEVAQKILENPASRGFCGINSLLELPNEQESI